MYTQAVIYIQADPQVWEACKENAETLCKGVKDGGGRIQSCLVGVTECCCVYWLPGGRCH